MARSTSGEFSVWYVTDGRVAGALSVGRSDDLEHARRLIASGEDIGGRVEHARGPVERPRVAVGAIRSRTRGPARFRARAGHRARGSTRWDIGSGRRRGRDIGGGRGRDIGSATGCGAPPRRTAGQPVDESAEPVDRALERRRHLERPLEGREHRDQLGAGLDDLAGSVGDFAPADVDPVTEVTHRIAELEQLLPPGRRVARRAT